MKTPWVKHNKLPIIHKVTDLANEVGVKGGFIRWLCFHKEVANFDHYERFKIKKRNGNLREISSPKRYLRKMQSWIKENILEALDLNESATAYRKGSNICQNAIPHLAQHIVVKIDLKDFFFSVSFSRVRGFFHSLGYSSGIATLFALICTDCQREKIEYRGKTYFVAQTGRRLQQGAITSPLLSNLIAQKLDSRITYRRTGPASFVNEFGKVVLVGDNVPRFDHDIVTRESKGLLIEESRTNSITHSSPQPQSANAGWFQNGAVITTNAATAPDGTNTASLVSDNSANQIHYNYFAQSLTAGVNHTLTAYLKEPDTNSIRYVRVTLHNCGAKVFDLQNGTIHDAGNGVRVVGDTTITPVGNGWFRIKITYTVEPGGSGNAYFIPHNGTTTNYAGTGKGFLIWGVQLEAGNFETSFIPTNGTTATRGQDLVEITEEEFSEFYNRTEGSFVSEIMLKPSFPVSGYATIMMSLSDSSYDNRVTLSSSTGSAAFNADVTVGGTNNRAVLGSYTSGSHSIKAAIAYKAADSAGSLNGAAAVTTSPSGTLPLLTRADIGKDHGNFNPLNGHINRIMYYSKRLSNNQLRTLTS